MPETEPAISFCAFIMLAVIALVISGSIYVATGDAFERRAHAGIIVNRYVSLRDTTTRASRAMLYEKSTSWQAGDMEAYVPGKSHQSKSTKHYANAVISYSLNDEHNVTFYKNCSMTVAKYADQFSATVGLEKVPIGKQKNVHVSKHHHSKYCIDKHELNYYHNTGMALLLTGCGLLALIAGGVCLCASAKALTTWRRGAGRNLHTHYTGAAVTDPNDSAERGQATGARYQLAHGKAGCGAPLASSSGSNRPHVPTVAENLELEMAQMRVLAGTPTGTTTTTTGVHGTTVATTD
jgi:hypothetical protein